MDGIRDMIQTHASILTEPLVIIKPRYVWDDERGEDVLIDGCSVEICENIIGEHENPRDWQDTDSSHHTVIAICKELNVDCLTSGTEVLDEVCLDQGHKTKEKLLSELLKRDELFRYYMVGRLISDYHYFVGAGNRHAKHLWATDDLEEHLYLLIGLVHSLPEDKRPTEDVYQFVKDEIVNIYLPRLQSQYEQMEEHGDCVFEYADIVRVEHESSADGYEIHYWFTPKGYDPECVILSEWAIPEDIDFETRTRQVFFDINGFEPTHHC